MSGNEKSAKRGSGNSVFILAIAANLGVAVVKFVVAVLTGSSSTLTEGFHSVVDTLNQFVVLYGRRRSATPADELHPFGYGRELYFWCFIVAVLIFAMGAGFSIYEGVQHILAPEPIREPAYVFIVLGIALVLEGASWVVSLRAFDRLRGDTTIWRAIRMSKDPSQFSVLLEDSAAIVGLLVAAAGTGLALLTGEPAFDGAASIVIGLVLAAVAFVLARESKGLLIGERGSLHLTDDLRRTLTQLREIATVRDLITFQMAPEQVVAVVSADFRPGVDAVAVGAAISAAERDVRVRYPALRAIYVRSTASDGE